MTIPAQMTPAAWSQGFKNVLICGVGFLIAWCVRGVLARDDNRPMASPRERHLD